MKDDFSLVLGGPLFQLWIRARLTGGALELLRRRVVVLVLLAWVPLLALSLAAGTAWGSSVALPFVRDIELHIRLLLALPLLIVAELVVHQRMRPVARQFVECHLVPDGARGQFDAAVASLARWRDSIPAELLILAFACIVGTGLFGRAQGALGVTSWSGSLADGGTHLSVAGWWLRVVSMPLFQFLLFRWYFRIFLWARFLWQVSRIKLAIVPTHPDRCGGLGFLSLVNSAFAPLLAAQGMLLAAMMAERIFYAGAALPQFAQELAGLVVLMLLAVLGPLLVFTPQLAAAKRAGLRQYGTLAQRYVSEFDQKWIRAGAPAGEPLLGSADLQSLADMGNSFLVVEGMRPTPIALKSVIALAVTTLLPILPLTLTMFSPRELLERLIKIVL